MVRKLTSDGTTSRETALCLAVSSPAALLYSSSAAALLLPTEPSLNVAIISSNCSSADFAGACPASGKALKAEGTQQATCFCVLFQEFKTAVRPWQAVQRVL